LTVEQQKNKDSSEPLPSPPLTPEKEAGVFTDFLSNMNEGAVSASRNLSNVQGENSSALRGVASFIAPGLTNKIIQMTSGVNENEATDQQVRDGFDLLKTSQGFLQAVGLIPDSAANAFVGKPLAERAKSQGGTEGFVSAVEAVGTIGPQVASGAIVPKLLQRVSAKGAAGKATTTSTTGGSAASSPGVETFSEGDFDIVFNDRVITTVNDAAKTVLKATDKKKQRLYLDIADSIRGVDSTGAKVNQIDVGAVQDVLARNDMDLETFVQVYKASVSGAGRTLARQSHTSRALSKTLADTNPELAEILLKNSEETATFGTKVFNAWRETDTFRRLAGTSQVVTAARNVAVSVPISAVQALDNAVEKVVTGGFTRDAGKQAFDTIIRYVKSFKAMSPKNQAKFLKQLEKSEGFTAEKLTGGVGIADATTDGALGPVKRVLSVFNRVQEKPLRMAAAEFKLLDMKKAKSIDEIDFAKLTEKELEEVTDYALQVTFANNPTSQTARRALQSFTDFGGTTVAPYPRFMFYNAPRWFLNHSPAGLTKLVMPKNLQMLKDGDPTRAARIISEAVTGTMLLSEALIRRKGENVGDQTQEFSTGDGGKVNLQPFAPLSFYDIVAEAIEDPDTFTGKDAAQIVAGMRSARDTPLEIINEALTDGDAKGAIKRMAGNYVGMMTVPFRQVKDVVSIFDPDESVSRSTKQQPITGKAQSNIPFLSQNLPSRRSLFEGGPITPDKEPAVPGVSTLPDRLNPVTSQFIPVTKEYRPRVESELLKVGIEPYKMYPRTGVDQADRFIVQEVGQLSSSYASQFLDSDMYTQHTTKAGKAKALKELYGSFTKMAKVKMRQDNPQLYARMKVEAQLTELDKQFLDEVGAVPEARMENFIQNGQPLREGRNLLPN